MRNSCTSQVGASQIYTWSCLCKAALSPAAWQRQVPTTGMSGCGDKDPQCHGHWWGWQLWEEGLSCISRSLKTTGWSPVCAQLPCQLCWQLLLPPPHPPAGPHCWACLSLPDAHLECTPCCPSRGEEMGEKSEPVSNYALFAFI